MEVGGGGGSVFRGFGVSESGGRRSEFVGAVPELSADFDGQQPGEEEVEKRRATKKKAETLEGRKCRVQSVECRERRVIRWFGDSVVRWAGRWTKQVSDDPERKEAENENGDTRRVVPGVNGVDTFGGGDINEEERAANIENKRKGKSGEDTKDAPQSSEPVKFSKEEGEHERGLKRTNAAARFIDADHAGVDFNDIAVRDRRDVEEAEQFGRGGDVELAKEQSQGCFQA